ncbi:MAG: fructosamine kinase family protein [Melioribacteraceae bacterium]|nr:fructosamine kinase family protein [Melioribacteraceae bacterium]
MPLTPKIEQRLSEKIISKISVGGGYIANACIITTESGNKYFVKSYGSNKEILRNETNGLKELAKAKAVRIPEVVILDDDFLLLEFIEQGNRSKTFSTEFGRQYAQMHKFKGEKFGFFENNFIGSNPQVNLPENDNWIEFFWQNRLLYQYKLAEHNHFVDAELKTSFKKLEQAFISIVSGTEEPPTILHGDLWGGNYMVDSSGAAVLIDPAVYYGHREADLAMTKLFGGFDSNFYHAYNEEFPLLEDWEFRIDLYMLYHVLNHLNLFGSGYYSQVISIIKKYI